MVDDRQERRPRQEGLSADACHLLVVNPCGAALHCTALHCSCVCATADRCLLPVWCVCSFNSITNPQRQEGKQSTMPRFQNAWLEGRR